MNARDDAAATRSIPTYCYQCVAGPDLLTVKTVNGVATEVQPNFCAAGEHPGAGRVCVKAYGLVQKTYNPHRLTSPMKRTNPKKGRHEDPGFISISWDEALDTIAERLRALRAFGLLDASGYPKLAASFGGGGTPQSYMGTFPAFLAAWGPVDMGFGSGQGVKCYHSEHLYGELWHRAFTVSPDTPLCDYLISCGANVEASGGVVGVRRHADARARGMKRVQVEPHLSVTGACSAEWVPIRPKTDAAFLFALLHVLLHETPRERLDVAFLEARTSSPYLVGPNGFFLRDPASRKPLVWDARRGAAAPFDAPDVEAALEGVRGTEVDAVEIGADGVVVASGTVEGETSFERLVAHLRPSSPEWAAAVCDVPAATIRRIANEFLDAARVGATIEIEGRMLPYRPVAVSLGKTVNNGWGGYECCWARTMLAALVGALEVPGGTLGTTVRLNRPLSERIKSVKPGADGFMAYPMNPTDPEHWNERPNIRNAYKTLVPLASDGPWSQALGPTHFSWMFLDGTPQGLPEVTLPEVWFVSRTNPAISFWDTESVAAKMARFPFTVAFAYTHDETNHMADILLPDATDLESLQLIRIGGSKYVEQFWRSQGFALRQPAVAPRGESRDFTDVATELARRTGILEAYNASINRGAAGVPLKSERWDHSLDTRRAHGRDEIWDAVCRAASAELGDEPRGLDWWKEHGWASRPFPQTDWYLYPALVERGLRFELPYQERLYRIGQELGNRLHDRGMRWWDKQLAEYRPLPEWKDFPGEWTQALVDAGGQPAQFPFWLITARSMQYAWGGNVGMQLIKEVADNVAGHRGVIVNARRAAELGIADGDAVEIATPARSVHGRAVLRHGIRPDTLLLLGQFDHWATPFAKEFGMPSLNALAPMSMALTDATGSGADLLRVALRRAP
ncbi:MAG TPA: molybdopterin-dependent oxidoreductase [Burkholderiales bacterium]